MYEPPDSFCAIHSFAELEVGAVATAGAAGATSTVSTGATYVCSCVAVSVVDAVFSVVLLSVVAEESFEVGIVNCSPT